MTTLFREPFFAASRCPDDAQRDLATARATDANPAGNASLLAHLRDAADRFVARAPELLGANLALGYDDASVHRLSAALTAERIAAWRERGAAGSADNELFPASSSTAPPTSAGKCVVRVHAAADGPCAARNGRASSAPRIARRDRADLAVFQLVAQEPRVRGLAPRAPRGVCSALYATLREPRSPRSRRPKRATSRSPIATGPTSRCRARVRRPGRILCAGDRRDAAPRRRSDTMHSTSI